MKGEFVLGLENPVTDILRNTLQTRLTVFRLQPFNLPIDSLHFEFLLPHAQPAIVLPASQNLFFPTIQMFPYFRSRSKTILITSEFPGRLICEIIDGEIRIKWG